MLNALNNENAATRARLSCTTCSVCDCNEEANFNFKAVVVAIARGVYFLDSRGRCVAVPTIVTVDGLGSRFSCDACAAMRLEVRFLSDVGQLSA